MERFDFTNYSNIRALVDAAIRAVNDQYADLRKARTDFHDGTGTQGFIHMKTKHYNEAMVLNYKLQCESYLMRADEEESTATSALDHARVNEHRACAATYLARADVCLAEAEDEKRAWLACAT